MNVWKTAANEGVNLNLRFAGHTISSDTSSRSWSNRAYTSSTLDGRKHRHSASSSGETALRPPEKQLSAPLRSLPGSGAQLGKSCNILGKELLIVVQETGTSLECLILWREWRVQPNDTSVEKHPATFTKSYAKLKGRRRCSM